MYSNTNRDETRLNREQLVEQWRLDDLSHSNGPFAHEQLSSEIYSDRRRILHDIGQRELEAMQQHKISR